MSINREMAQENMVIYTMEYSLATKKEWNNTIFPKVDWTRDYHLKWNNSKASIKQYHLHVGFFFFFWPFFSFFFFYFFFLKKFIDFYCIYSCTMIIITQSYSISILKPQVICPTPLPVSFGNSKFFKVCEMVSVLERSSLYPVFRIHI